MMTRISATRWLTLAAVFGLAFNLSGCLKTRAQLKEDGDEPSTVSSPIPVKQGPTDVMPQGGYALDEVKSEMTRMEGRVEDLERAQKDKAQAPGTPTADDYKKLETRVTELEQAQTSMLEAIKKLQEMPAAAPDPVEMLKKGKNQVEAGNIEGSIETFSACLRSAKGKTAEECTFNRAESYYALKDYKKAIVDYSKFPEKYTRSTFMPKALYRIGLSFDQLGMRDDAKGFYQELVEKYPKSPEAKKAKSKAQ
jgi:TolA-binding protein